MKRLLWVKAHLFAASFFAPALLAMAVSGGLYLVGIKGNITQTTVPIPTNIQLNLQSKTLEDDVSTLLTNLGIDYNFEYLKQSGNVLYTRPTSKTHYEIKVTDDAVSIARNEPDLLKSLVELHKGHGPGLFKDFQKAMAIGLLFVLLSGTWLGLSSAGLRASTLATVAGGISVFAVLAIFV